VLRAWMQFQKSDTFLVSISFCARIVTKKAKAEKKKKIDSCCFCNQKIVKRIREFDTITAPVKAKELSETEKRRKALHETRRLITNSADGSDKKRVLQLIDHSLAEISEQNLDMSEFILDDQLQGRTFLLGHVIALACKYIPISMGDMDLILNLLKLMTVWSQELASDADSYDWDPKSWMHSFIPVFASVPENLESSNSLKRIRLEIEDIEVPVSVIDEWHYYMELPHFVTKALDDVLYAFLDFQITTLKMSEGLSRKEVLVILQGVLNKITRQTHKARELLRQEIEHIYRGEGEWDFDE